jgi:epoxyqueuosine reductase
MNLKQDLIAEAHRLGFLLTGVTLPTRPPHFSQYEEWLDGGRHGTMAYLANERARQHRADPHLILPEVRSILCLGLPYGPAAKDPFLRQKLQKSTLPLLTPPPSLEGAGGIGSSSCNALQKAQEEQPLTGQIASYAWGPDYHTIIPPRLAQLVAFVEGRLQRPIIWRGYTDTGPILERDLAMQAGLGWIGKNTSLISPHSGSFFLLAEMMWDVELEPDPPLTHDFCGTCRRCITACPTGCILPNRTLDARRCISYLTIENKGTIPPELRPASGNWIFGCDICQQVCPWNQRFARGVGDPAFTPQSQFVLPALLEELQLSPQAFNQKFRSSPILRAKRRGYLRNVAVALGNFHDPAAIAALTETLLHEPEPLVRAHAAWALGQIEHPLARSALEKARGHETDSDVQEEIETALSQ